MTPEQITQVIQGGRWVSITTELRLSTNTSASGEIQPFYCSRVFTYSPGDRFACTVMNYADPTGKVPLVKIVITGHNAWQGEHPIAKGAYNLDYIADEAYEVTPLHQGFADVANTFPGTGLNMWEVNVMQDVKGKPFRCLVWSKDKPMSTTTSSISTTTCFSMEVNTLTVALLTSLKTGPPICKSRW
jgi:hypothetical protein